MDTSATANPASDPAGEDLDAVAERNPLRVLLDVQAHDLELDRISYRQREHPERARLAELERLRVGLTEKVAELTTERTNLAGQQDGIENRVVAIEARVAGIDKRLRSGSAGSFRDQQAMAVESDSLDKQRRELEDQELEIMEQLEPIDAELEALAEQLSALEGDRAEVTAVVDAAVAELRAEASVLHSERDKLAAGLPPALASIYEKLRSKLGGIGAAKLADGGCSGCHLKLPARERDLIVHAPSGTVFYCEQCGRILVP